MTKRARRNQIPAFKACPGAGACERFLCAGSSMMLFARAGGVVMLFGVRVLEANRSQLS